MQCVCLAHELLSCEIAFFIDLMQPQQSHTSSQIVNNSKCCVRGEERGGKKNYQFKERMKKKIALRRKTHSNILNLLYVNTYQTKNTRIVQKFNICEHNILSHTPTALIIIIKSNNKHTRHLHNTLALHTRILYPIASTVITRTGEESSSCEPTITLHRGTSGVPLTPALPIPLTRMKCV